MAKTLLERYRGETVLGIGAHPDDLEIGVGGTLAKLRLQGTRVIMAVASIPGDIAKRIPEARRGAEILDCEAVFLNAERPSRVEDLKTYQLGEWVDMLIREYRPAALLTHGNRDLHKDHLIVNQVCITSERLNLLDCFTYYPTTCRPASIPFHPRAFVDVSEVLERKIESIEAHLSQFSERGLCTAIFRQIAAEQGRISGLPYAEGLDVVRIGLG